MGNLVRALGAEVDPFSRGHQCCGGAGEFTNNSPNEAIAFIQKKFDAILEETQTDCIITSCITGLMHRDKVQKTLNEKIVKEKYTLPVFDYSQLLPLCMGYDPKEVACISTIPKDAITARF